ncbi:MAG: hypothetical protein GY856_17700 [bacterium]|nr:hypothetical protein [bacterium]
MNRSFLTSVVLILTVTGTATATQWNVPGAPGGACTVADPNCATIGAAVAAASSGDTILIAAGVYDEQVAISTGDLTLTGAGRQDTIIRPTTVSANTTSLSSGAAAAAIVLIDAVGGITIEDLQIDGGTAAFGACSPGYVGVFFRNGSGTLRDSWVRNVFHPGAPGCQFVLGVLVQTADPESALVTVHNNIVENYGKNGITCNDDASLGGQAGDTVATVSGNTVVGRGPLGSGEAAQNGIQIGSGAAAVVSSNYVEGHSYTPFTWVAAGMLFQNPEQVNTYGNRLHENQVGIYHIEGPGGEHAFNKISASNAGTSSPAFWGIVVDAPPPADQRPPTSPFGPIDQSGSSAPSELLSGTLQHVGVFGNLLSGDTAGVGLEADAGYGARDIKLVAESNALEGFGSNIVIYECSGSCSGTGFVEVSLRCNRIVDSVTDGVYSNATTAVDARDNWWGCNDGPGAPGCDAVTGPGVVLAGSWLQLSLDPLAKRIRADSVVPLTAELTETNTAADPLCRIPDWTPVSFSASSGDLTPPETGTQDGTATAVLSGMSAGPLTVEVTVDHQTVAGQSYVMGGTTPP